MNRWLLLLFVSTTLINCHSDDIVRDDSVTPIHGQGLAGTWLFYETGYSPGAGYIIEKVPSKPQQTLTFTTDGHIQAQGDGLTYYQAFSQFRLDTINQAVRIHYAPSVPDYSEGILLRNDTLRLYQSCYEGCHSGFLRIK